MSNVRGPGPELTTQHLRGPDQAKSTTESDALRPAGAVDPGPATSEELDGAWTARAGSSRPRRASGAIDISPRMERPATASLELGSPAPSAVAGTQAAPPQRTLGAAGTPGHRYARDFTVAQILAEPAAADRLVTRYLQQEREFFLTTRDPKYGLTYEGMNLDPKTGRLRKLRKWSAASKEGLDLGVWIKALAGDPKAAILVSGGDVSSAKTAAIAMLEKKIEGYEVFHSKYPGYGGFLPWFQHSANGRIEPSADWRHAAPGLDNGEWVWTMHAVETLLRDSGQTELAARYSRYNDMLRRNVVPMFYDAQAGKVRGDVQLSDPRSPDAVYGALPEGKEGMRFLDGPSGVHEGMMLVLYVSLLGKGLPEGAADRLWDTIDMKRVESPHGTTWQGWWASPHESWAYLFLPLRDLPEYRDLFRIREKIRSHNAVERGYPGFAASVNAPGDRATAPYLSAGGVEGISATPLDANHVYAFYGVFPMLQHFSDVPPGTPNHGLAWLLNTLQAPRAVGPLGSGESGTNDGSAVSSMKTIDGSLPIALATMGGTEREMAATLRELGVYDRFVELMRRQYDKAFGATPLREPVDFAPPRARVPTDRLSDYEAAD